MASAKIEDRVKFLGGPWDAIKGKNNVLTKGLFKPPMDPLVDKYDDDKSAYSKLQDQKKDLHQVLVDFVSKYEEGAATAKKLGDETKKVEADEAASYSKSTTDFNKCFNDPDPNPADVISALTKTASVLDDISTVRKGLVDKKAALAASQSAYIKKTAADYKTKSDAIVNGIKKIEDDMNKLDDQIRKLVQAYQKTANDMDHEDVADAVRGLLDFLP